MKTIAVSQFKGHVLRILEQIAQEHQPVLITKKGKPLARILPCEESHVPNTPGQLADTLIFEEDIVSPLGEEMWGVCS